MAVGSTRFRDYLMPQLLEVERANDMASNKWLDPKEEDYLRIYKQWYEAMRKELLLADFRRAMNPLPPTKYVVSTNAYVTVTGPHVEQTSEPPKSAEELMDDALDKAVRAARGFV
jgi:formaldehyde-activating enzyme involved in methanogenesis